MPRSPRTAGWRRRTGLRSVTSRRDASPLATAWLRSQIDLKRLWPFQKTSSIGRSPPARPRRPGSFARSAPASPASVGPRAPKDGLRDVSPREPDALRRGLQGHVDGSALADDLEGQGMRAVAPAFPGAAAPLDFDHVALRGVDRAAGRRAQLAP